MNKLFSLMIIFSLFFVNISSISQNEVTEITQEITIDFPSVVDLAKKELINATIEFELNNTNFIFYSFFYFSYLKKADESIYASFTEYDVINDTHWNIPISKAEIPLFFLGYDLFGEWEYNITIVYNKVNNTYPFSNTSFLKNFNGKFHLINSSSFSGVIPVKLSNKNTNVSGKNEISSFSNFFLVLALPFYLVRKKLKNLGDT